MIFLIFGVIKMIFKKIYNVLKMIILQYILVKKHIVK